MSTPRACPAPARSWPPSATTASAASATTANGRDAPCRPCGDPQVESRGRAAADDAAIRRLNDDAFGGNYESRLIEDLRAAGLDAVELGAVGNDDIVGHILFSVLATTIDRQTVPALALAPMAVRPDRQRRGIGSALMRAGLELARDRDWRAIIVLGHKGYYPRFGFSAAQSTFLERRLHGTGARARRIAGRGRPRDLPGGLRHHKHLGRATQRRRLERGDEAPAEHLGGGAEHLGLERRLPFLALGERHGEPDMHRLGDGGGVERLHDPRPGAPR